MVWVRLNFEKQGKLSSASFFTLVNSDSAEMGNLKLALIIKSPRDDVEFLLEKQKQPAKFGDEAYDSFVDSDLWDLPSTDLQALEDGVRSGFSISILDSCSEEVDLMNFDFESTLILVIYEFSTVLFFSLFPRINVSE